MSFDGPRWRPEASVVAKKVDGYIELEVEAVLQELLSIL